MCHGRSIYWGGGNACGQNLKKLCRDGSKEASGAHVASGGSQNTSKIDAGKGPKRVPKPLSHENGEMSRNPIIYYTKAISAHLRKPLFSTMFGSETVRESTPKENVRKVAQKYRRKCSGGAQGCSKESPRDSSGSPRAPKMGSKIDENSVRGCTWASGR